jgi:NAD(P)-dependent dehydrogenase (short-subunit alcohol dehydrogenase family)
MSTNIEGKVVVITGASSGLGEAAARLLSAEGASVVLGARRTDRIQSLADELTGKGGKALALNTDVTDYDQVKRLVDAAVQTFGRVDVVGPDAAIAARAPQDRRLEPHHRREPQGRTVRHRRGAAAHEAAEVGARHQRFLGGGSQGDDELRPQGDRVTQLADPPLAPWGNFYVIVGSSGAALIGIQFVVIALIADMRKRTPADSISAFATPPVVHLGGALVVSALMSAPWHSLVPASIAVATCGVGGLGYATSVIHRARRQTTYTPVWQDWVWYALLPCSAYAALVVAAFGLGATTYTAVFVIGAAALGLLLIGIHNAWDTVTHVVVTGGHRDETRTQ